MTVNAVGLVSHHRWAFIQTKKPAMQQQVRPTQADATINTSPRHASLLFGIGRSLPMANPLLQPHLSLLDFKQKLGLLEQSASKGPARSTIMAQLTEVVDEYLQGRWTDQTQPHKLSETLAVLKRLSGGSGKGNIVVAQINPEPAHFSANAKKIMNYYKVAEFLGADTIVFPEASLIGYPIRDVVTQFPWLMQESMKWLNAMAKQTGKTHAIVGFVEPRQPSPNGFLRGRDFYNAAAVLGEGHIKHIVRKTLLPTYKEFEDWRQFEANTEEPKLVTINGKKVGITICEDGWNDQTFFDKRPLYVTDPVEKVMQLQPDLLINISASTSRDRKEQLRHNMLKSVAAKYRVPYLYVNQSGAIDETSFDGTSRLYNAAGKLTARAKSFQEQFLLVNPSDAKGKVYGIPAHVASNPTTAASQFEPFSEADLPRTYETILQGIRDYFRKRGYTNRAVLGISGGLDSAVTATLLADALGPENVIGIRMSSKITSNESEDEAAQLGKNLGIHMIDLPIKDAVDVIEKQVRGLEPLMATKFGPLPNGPNVNPYKVPVGNIQARLRMVNIYAIGNLYRAIPIATSDKSELYMGYTTIGGDMLGELAPIADVPKCKVRQLARWMNQHRDSKDAIPVNTIEKKSGAELERDPRTGHIVMAEDDLMPYPFLDELIWRHEALKQSPEQMLQSRFWLEDNSTQAITDIDKKQWIEKFYRRLQHSVIKWWLAPPSILVSGHGSILKSDYHHPITSQIIPNVWAQPATAIHQQLQEAPFEALKPLSV